MENASKALIIAGAMLISVALISLFIFVFSAIGTLSGQEQAQQASNQVIAANRFFTESAYDRDPGRAGIQVYGYDAYNLIRKADDMNDSVKSEVEITIDANRSLFSFDAQGFLTDAGKANMLSLFDYSYSMDGEGYVNYIRLSKV